jgi:hypothetical protein
LFNTISIFISISIHVFTEPFTKVFAAYKNALEAFSDYDKRC